MAVLLFAGINVADSLCLAISAHDHLLVVCPVGDIGDAGLLLFYLGILLVMLPGDAFLVGRQALMRPGVDEPAKSLGELIISEKGSGKVRKCV